MGVRMGIDLAAVEPGRVVVVESARRLRREQSYGFIHALWFLWLDDGRAAVSVPPGAADGVSRVVSSLHDREGVFGPLLNWLLKGPVDAALSRAGLGGVDRALCDVDLACNASLLHRHRCGDCRRITDDSLPIAKGIEYPDHCFPDGIVYGVVADGKVVSLAHAHRPGLMEDQVADLGVPGTVPAYRRRGYAKTCVSAVVEHITRTGGEARYGSAPENAASIATARSVGFVPYGVSLVLAAPAPDTEG
jgi:ribosomal protein S18 acetylase RimI-like enzyme